MLVIVLLVETVSDGRDYSYDSFLMFLTEAKAELNHLANSKAGCSNFKGEESKKIKVLQKIFVFLKVLKYYCINICKV